MTNRDGARVTLAARGVALVLVILSALALGLASSGAAWGQPESHTAQLVTGSPAGLPSVVAGTGPTAILEIVPVHPPGGLCGWNVCLNGSTVRAACASGDDCPPVAVYPPGTKIVGNELSAYEGGFRAWFEYRASNWDPEGDGTVPTNPIFVQIGFDRTGFFDADTSDPGTDPADDGDQPDLVPAAGIACSSSHDDACAAAFGEFWAECEFGFCKPSYDDHKGYLNPRSFCRDPVSGPVCDQTGCDTQGGSGHRCFANTYIPRIDDHTTDYVGTLVLDIPVDAFGRYTVNLQTNITFLASQTAPPRDIPVAVERGFTVNILGGQCCFGLFTPDAGCVEGVLRAECGDDEPDPVLFVPDASCSPAGPDCESYFGACCDTMNGTCQDPVLQADCGGSHAVWTSGVPCGEVECSADTGACCDHDPFRACTDASVLADCECPTCTWYKLRRCEEIDCPVSPIPTTSAWGLAVLALLLMITAKVAFARRGLRTAA